MSGDSAQPQALDALWERVLLAWDDDKVHEAILQYGLRTQSLPELAGRYRDLLGDPSKGNRAKQRIDAIVTAVTAQLTAMKTPRVGRVPVAMALSALGACALVLAWLGWVLWGPR